MITEDSVNPKLAVNFQSLCLSHPDFEITYMCVYTWPFGYLTRCLWFDCSLKCNYLPVASCYFSACLTKRKYCLSSFSPQDLVNHCHFYLTKSIHFQDFTVAPFQIQYCNIYALEKVNPRMHMFLYQLFIAEYLNPSNLYESKQQELSFLSFMEFEFYGVISQMLPSGWSNETWTQTQWLYPIVSEPFSSYGMKTFPLLIVKTF